MDCNYLFGKLNKEVIHKDYEGLTSDTASTIIKDDTIKVDVLKVPNDLIVLDENSQIAYNGSDSKIIDLRSIRESIPNNGDVEKTSEDNSILHIKRDDKNLFDIDLGEFIQSQSDLSQEDESSDSYVKNKSTKYLKNEGSDGTSTYVENKDLKRWLDLDNEELQNYSILRLGEPLDNPNQMLGVRLYKDPTKKEVKVDIGQFLKEINKGIESDNYIGISLSQNKNGKFGYIYNNHKEYSFPDSSGQLALTTDLPSYTAGNNISIEDNVIDTKNVLRLDSSDLQECSGFTLGKVYGPSSGTISGVNYEPNSSGDVDLNIGRYKPGTTLAYDYHRMRIRGGQYNGMISHLHQGVIGSLNFPIGNYNLNLPVKNGTLATTDDLPKYSGLVLTQMNGNVNGDTVNLTFDKVNLATGESGTADTYAINAASETNPGLMTSADVKALSDLQQRVGNLETKTTRLIYTAKTDPTAEEINTFVTGLGYIAPFSGIAVVVDKTYHIWHYYENDGWKDDGMDTVNLFTNETAGAIKGAGEVAGKIYAENDGTGSVYGWDALNTKVDGKQDKLTAGNNINITDGTIDTKNVVTYTDEYIDDANIRGIKKDSFAIRYTNSNTDNFRFESGYLTLFSNNKLRFFDASNQYKGLFTPDMLRRSVSGTTYDLTFPDKSGTFALTSDISSAQGVTITALSGTLTTEQLNTLKASTENYIKMDVGEEGKPTYFIFRYVGTETITVEGVNVTEIQYILPLGYQLILIAVNSETGVYENKTMRLQSDLDEYVINLSGESGTLTSEQVSAIQSGNVNTRIKLQVSTEDTALYYAYYEYNSTTNIRDYYFEGIRDGIEYSIHCEIDIAGTSTWTLTKRYLEIEVPLNDDGTISDESLALIEKYGEHTYIMNSNIRYNFVIKEIGKKNFIKYSNIENDVGRTITVWTDDKTWMEQYNYLAEKPDTNGGFKLYNDQWEASESSYGAFKQVVTYTHYVNNYNEYTILPLSTSLRMWAECGVGAFEETANDITFYAQTKPTDSLSFNIKHEAVEYSEV